MNVAQIIPNTTTIRVKCRMVKGRVIEYSKKEAIYGDLNSESLMLYGMVNQSERKLIGYKTPLRT